MSSAIDSLNFNPAFSLKNLEEPVIYDKVNDELYELNQEAYQFLLSCARGNVRVKDVPTDAEAKEFIDFCIEEEILAVKPVSAPVEVVADSTPNPSLRYLEVQLTDRCNLRCHHCFLGDTQGHDMGLEHFYAVAQQFEALQGLKMMLTGGEPLLYPHFWEINEKLPKYDFRSVLLSNGHLISREAAQKLNVHEVQLSIDGMEEAHDSLRGRGSFRKVTEALEALLACGKKVSIATMIHARNLNDFAQLEKLIDQYGIDEWNIDFPTPTGRLAQNEICQVTPEVAAPLMQYSRSGGHFNGNGPWACGAHLATATVDGHLEKCSFYSTKENPIFEIGLRAAWVNTPRVTLVELECDCEYLEQCKGGCRFRAETFGNPKSPDPLQCHCCGVI
ncbi:radical SAM protein [Metallumcola ferriviriculae]|uniref:Radical SAM protein n=1 Tax=Metallumcola ferriviriculae TaxID=3039180 RepID=A0AAU0UID5_9FIRM|nr:radical SAM protein [Desulfitibacteraceae bacterium MK1]